MGSQEIPLFRAEIVQKRVDRLHGSISLATPMAWQVIGFLLLNNRTSHGMLATMPRNVMRTLVAADITYSPSPRVALYQG